MNKKRFARWIILLFILISGVGASSPIFADDYQTTTISVNFVRKILPDSLPGNSNNSESKIEIAKRMPETNEVKSIIEPIVGSIIVSTILLYVILKRRKTNEKYI